MPSRQPQYWPEHWDGALAAAQQYFRETVGLDFRRVWDWLVRHRELFLQPSDHYDPSDDAAVHVAGCQRSQCLACGVWRMPQKLWAFGRDLYEGREQIQLLQAVRGLERRVTKFRCQLQSSTTARGKRSAGLLIRLLGPRVLSASLERARDGLLAEFGPDARACVEHGGRMGLIVASACLTLAQAGFSYPEIASMIGDDSEGATDRVRKRVLGLR